MTAESDKTFVIEEQISHEILEALPLQYRNAYEALLELTDNSFDNRTPGRTLFAYINTGPDRLGVSDLGGLGMNREELANFFRWGRSEKTRRLGRYGYGGKAAVASLASSFRLLTAKEGGERTYEISEEAFDKRPEGLKRFEVREIPQRPGHGFFQIEMSNLKRKIDPRRLAEILGSTYRLAVASRRLAIQVNGQDVEPLEISLVKGSVEEFEFETLIGEKVTGWVGHLDPKARKSKQIKPGMRGYVYGRLIADEVFFDFPDAKTDPGLRALIGEFNVDSDRIPLLPAKTDFVRDDVQWEYIAEHMHQILAPHVAELISEQEKQRVPRGDRPAFDLAEKIVRYGFLKMGEFTQEIAPTRTRTRKNRQETDQTSKPVRGGGEKTPKTRAPREARGERTRLPVSFTIISRDMGVDTRSALVSEAGILKLCICPNFSAYRLASSKGKEQLAFYILETAAFELGKRREEGEEELSVADYWIEANRIFREFTEAARKIKLL